MDFILWSFPTYVSCKEVDTEVLGYSHEMLYEHSREGLAVCSGPGQ